MSITGADANKTKAVDSATLAALTPRQNDIPHICVCICTYKRPLPLSRLLRELSTQETGGLFTYSLVVIDNDSAQSGEATVAQMRLASTIPIQYAVEPRQSIALARNRAVANADGDYIAFIDDDEFPAREWLHRLFTTCQQYKVDGVLGPVRRFFDEVPPAWLKKSHLLDRKVNPTGLPVDWHEARTGNVLLKKEICSGDPGPFRPEFRSGSDTDFFRRKIEEGRTFVWSADADVFEVLPPARWSRTYYIKRALLTGAMEPKAPSFGIRDVLKSVIAIPLYVAALPFALLLGQHRFMSLLFSLCHHVGKMLALLGIHVVRGAYLTD
jgi:succinoglycan biosynthesis protein ExoM